MPLIKRLDNTVFAVHFSEQVAIDQSKMYVRARYTMKPSEFLDADPPESFSTTFFYQRPRDLFLPDPDIIVSKVQSSLLFTTYNFALYLCVYLCDNSSPGLRLSENFFHLTPGWPVEVQILSEEHWKARICYKSVYDTYV